MSLVQLPQTTVRLLGSAQVITTVSSVVKELMENCFDAAATNIEIRLEKHGLEKIEVKDDGYGIQEADCLCMALPHYTSKIRDFSDLEKVQSYGFRGEALNSLCAIASVTVITRTEDDEVARSYQLDNCGQVVVAKVTHGVKGTTVTVSNLFKNLPVRKQVMSSGKRVNQELKRVEDVVKSLAVVHPRVRVCLAHNKFLIWQKPSVAHLKLSVMQVVSHNITRLLHHIVYNLDQTKIELLVPKRDCDVKLLCTGAAAESYYIFINKRPVRDKKIEKAMSDVFFQYFGQYLPPNKWPVCFILISIPPEVLDVNLEPNKTRIFIKDQENLLDCLKDHLGLYYCEPSGESGEKCPEDDKNKLKRKRKAEENIELLPTVIPCKEVKSLDFTDEIVGISQAISMADGVISARNSCSIAANPCQTKKLDSEFMSSDSGDSLNDAFISSGVMQKKDIHGEAVVNELESKALDSFDLNSHVKSSTLVRQQNTIKTAAEPPVSTSSQKTESSVESLPTSFEMGDYLDTVFSTASSSESQLTPVTNIESDDILNIGTVENDLSLSQWSKGYVSVNNKQKIQGACVLQQSLFGSKLRTPVEEDSSKLSLVLKGSNEDRSIKPGMQNRENDSNSNHSKTSVGTDTSKSHKCVSRENDQPELIDNGNFGKASTENDNGNGSGEPFEVEHFNSSSCHFAKQPPTPIDSNDALERSVSSQMGRKEMSAFTKFAREMRSKILKESPGMAFTAVAGILASKWRNLQEDERDKYKTVALHKKSLSSGEKEKILNANTPKKPCAIERNSVSVNISLEAIKKSVFNKSCDSSNGFNILGQIESSDVWMYSIKSDEEKKTDIRAISSLRFNEAYIFKQNMDFMIIPVKVLEDSIPITASDLGINLWHILTSLDSDFDIKTNLRIITDNRIIMNGFRISIVQSEPSSDVHLLLTDVALNINFYGVEDLRKTLILIERYGKNCTVAQSRCQNAVKYIKSETLRQCAQTTELNNKEGVLQMLNEWLKESDKNECPHSKPVYRTIHSLENKFNFR